MSRQLLLTGVALTVLLLLTIGTTARSSLSAADPTVEGLTLRTLGNRADLLSGGEALLELRTPHAGVRVTVDGRDVTEQFQPAAGGRLLGLVDGLPVGGSQVVATLPDGLAAHLALTVHSDGGPIVSGEQVEPWPCRTDDYGLGPAWDEDCRAPSVVSWFHLPADGDQLRPFDPAHPPPAEDVARVTTDAGAVVPFVVRRERGVLNRGIHDIAVLADPAVAPSTHQPPPAWNRRLVWPFGGSCQPHHGQLGPGERPDGDGAPGVLDDVSLLARGFMVATSGLNVLGSNCNTVVSAEAVMMLKEHIVETYGEVVHTIGVGGSGGAIGQLQVAAAYPGLLDGLVLEATYPDILTLMTEALDCRLLQRFFLRAGWHAAEQGMATGQGSGATCRTWTTGFGFPAMLAAPTVGCTAPLLAYREDAAWGVEAQSVEADWVWNPVTNPDGVRCTLADYLAAVVGRTSDGRAPTLYANAGVQYGLAALLDGELTPERFVALNVGIGGYDDDHRPRAPRSQADAEGLRRAHAAGLVTDGAALQGLPILDTAAVEADADIHSPVHAWSLHERLAAGGDASTHVIRQGLDRSTALHLMDDWLSGVGPPPDPAPVGRYRRVGPRIAAGAPLANDVVACALRPLDRHDYPPGMFSDSQWHRLASVFPDGVCDWSRPGVGATPTIPWARHSVEGGPVPLGPAPTSG